MDKEHVKGAAKKAEGSIKETVGKATGNDRLKNEGRADKAEGHVRSAVGDAKDAAREASKPARK
ncbi:MAG: CsbD family protein [Proteobacteria bacterium]|nr:CsbD family protein [Pseudomonadota bacterium]MDA0951373.1 CsbD family protein [Pseudomonadota bacterium]